MRLIAIALLAGTSLGLAACGSAADEAAGPAAGATDAVAASPASPLPGESTSPSPIPTASAIAMATPTEADGHKDRDEHKDKDGRKDKDKDDDDDHDDRRAGPPAAFAQCKVCHSVEKGDHGIGPSLAGVFGTKAGEIPGYQFSDAMKNSGLTWNAANLDKFLENPRAVVPGTKMAFVGIKDAAKRKAVVDYMKTL